MKSQRVQEILDKEKTGVKIQMMDKTAHTAQEAAEVLGCRVSQIAKSLVFKTESGKYFIVVAAGDKRVDEEILEQAVEEKVVKAPAKEAEKITGFTIGGIPPMGHKVKLPVYFDNNLLAQKTIWAAGGHHQALFEIDPKLLLKVCQGIIFNL